MAALLSMAGPPLAALKLGLLLLVAAHGAHACCGYFKSASFSRIESKLRERSVPAGCLELVRSYTGTRDPPVECRNAQLRKHFCNAYPPFYIHIFFCTTRCARRCGLVPNGPTHITDISVDQVKAKCNRDPHRIRFYCSCTLSSGRTCRADAPFDEITDSYMNECYNIKTTTTTTTPPPTLPPPPTTTTGQQLQPPPPSAPKLCSYFKTDAFKAEIQGFKFSEEKGHPCMFKEGGIMEKWSTEKDHLSAACSGLHEDAADGVNLCQEPYAPFVMELAVYHCTHKCWTGCAERKGRHIARIGFERVGECAAGDRGGPADISNIGCMCMFEPGGKWECRTPPGDTWQAMVTDFKLNCLGYTEA